MNLDDSPKFLFAIKKDAEEEAKMRIKAFSVVHNKQLGTTNRYKSSTIYDLF
jgi:hypothetical protein